MMFFFLIVAKINRKTETDKKKAKKSVIHLFFLSENDYLCMREIKQEDRH